MTSATSEAVDLGIQGDRIAAIGQAESEGHRCQRHDRHARTRGKPRSPEPCRRRRPDTVHRGGLSRTPAEVMASVARLSRFPASQASAKRAARSQSGRHCNGRSRRLVRRVRACSWPGQSSTSEPFDDAAHSCVSYVLCGWKQFLRFQHCKMASNRASAFARRSSDDWSRHILFQPIYASGCVGIATISTTAGAQPHSYRGGTRVLRPA